MTAMRLAEHVAKTTDVDGMLDDMTPQQWIEWQAKDIIEPIGTNSVCGVLAKIGELISAFVGGHLDQRDFMPWLPKVQKQQALSPAESATAMTAALRGVVK